MGGGWIHLRQLCRILGAPVHARSELGTGQDSSRAPCPRHGARSSARVLGLLQIQLALDVAAVSDFPAGGSWLGDRRQPVYLVFRVWPPSSARESETLLLDAAAGALHSSCPQPVASQFRT